MIQNLIFSCGVACAVALTTDAVGQSMHHEGVPAHIDRSPAGVMGHHMHHAKEFMVAYRLMRMKMAGSRDGTNSVSSDDVLARFSIVPLSMSSEMHMFGAMYATSERLTMMVMVPYVRKTMDHVTRPAMGGEEFTTTSSGIGDIRLSGMIGLLQRGSHDIHLNVGISIPSGSTAKRDDTPMMANAKLPYPMQIGSGTFDLLPGVTYSGESGPIAWGAHILSTVRLGKNSRQYSFGDGLESTIWGAAEILDWLSGSLRLSYQRWGDVKGADPDLNPMMVQTAAPDIQAGRRLDLLFGIDLLGKPGALDGHRFAVEFGFPVFQNLNGPQLETDWTINAGWQYKF